MTHYIASAIRFLCFYVMATLTLVAISTIVTYLLLINIGTSPDDMPPIFILAFSKLWDAAVTAPATLIISAWTWDSSKSILAPIDMRPARRAALQGGLSWCLVPIITALMLRSPVVGGLAIISAFTGAFWGWLIFHRLWPNLPALKEPPTEAEPSGPPGGVGS